MEPVYISEIQRFCVHDGPGIRTTVFFQDCPLHCRWCQNPETLSPHPLLLFSADLCGGCGACVRACPHDAISMGADGIAHTDPSRCTQCGACCEPCYFLARKLSAHTYTVDQLFQTVMRDEVVFRNSGGGVTVSGGEPLLHPGFCEELLGRCKNAGVTTAVETAGCVPQQAIDRLIPVVDTFLFDLKLFHLHPHKKWTGVDNGLILSNLRRVANLHNNVVIRIPLIPGVNDTEYEFSAMMDFAAGLRQINGVHILPFHQLGAGKYNLIGVKYTLADLSEDNDEGVARCEGIAKAYGFRVDVGGTGFLSDRR